MQIRALKLQGNQQPRRGIRDFPAAQSNLFGNFRFGTGYFEIRCSKSVLELAPCSITKFSNKADQQDALMRSASRCAVRAAFKLFYKIFCNISDRNRIFFIDDRLVFKLIQRFAEVLL